MSQSVLVWNYKSSVYYIQKVHTNLECLVEVGRHRKRREGRLDMVNKKQGDGQKVRTQNREKERSVIGEWEIKNMNEGGIVEKKKQ